MTEEVAVLKAELLGLNQQLIGVSEHRTRLMVCLTDRSREIADLMTDLTRTRSESNRHLEEMQSTARQLKRAEERANELSTSKQDLQTRFSQLSDELETARWDLASTRGSAAEAESRAKEALEELARVRVELDALRRTLEAQSEGWVQEREQLQMSLAGLSLEVQSEHQAARDLERRWLLSTASATISADAVQVTHFDPEASRIRSLKDELSELREAHAERCARVRELEREAGRVIELERNQQELRQLQVEHQLLKRKLEDSGAHHEERDALRQEVGNLRGQLRDTDSLRAEVERLRSKLYKAPLNSGTFPLGERIEAIGRGELPSRDLTGMLAEFAHQADAASAVVADSLGFPVAVTGAANECESLAAVASDADRLRTQARQLLGLAEVTQLTVEDREGRLAVFRYFAIESDLMSIGMLVSQAPGVEQLDDLVGFTRHALMTPRIRNDIALTAAHRRSVRSHSAASGDTAIFASVSGVKP